MKNEGRYARYEESAKALGAREARVIPARGVFTAEWVRLKCRFGCGGFGGSLTCPPCSPTPEETRRMLLRYESAVLVHGDEWTDIQGVVSALEREVFLDGFHKAFGMGAGPCSLCGSCPAEGRSRNRACRHPEKARPSMEACGIDVFGTARAHGFPIEVLRSTRCGGNYYGLVLIE